MREGNGHPVTVLKWREEQASLMGFDDVMASFIALSRMDLTMIKSYIDQGCPPDVAVRILIGTDFTGNDDPTWGVLTGEVYDDEE